MRKQARSAVIWSGMDLLLRQGGAFAITVVLARILTPEDFGTIALLSFFIALGILFSNAGFSLALIQRQDVSHVDESTVFWFNVLAAFIVALILIVLAEWISGFFDIIELQSLLYLMAFAVVVSSFGSIHTTLLSKSLDFKTQAIAGFLSMLFSGVIAIYMAYHGYGVWALASQTVISACITTFFLWLLHPWRPLFIFSNDSLKRMFGFGGYMFAATFLQILYNKGYTLLLGKFFEVSQLGLFDRADKSQRLVSETVTGVAAKVTFPLYSKYSDNSEALRKIVRMSVRSLMLVMAPVMLSMLVFAESIIPGVFGDQWYASVPIFQVLCVVGLFYPIQSVNVTALQAQGHADLNFRLTVVKRVLGILLLVLGSYWGVMGVAWSMVLQSCISLVINGFYSRKFLRYGTLTQLKDCFPSLLVSIVMLLCLLLFNSWCSMDTYLLILCDAIIGILIYFGLNIALGLSAFKEVIEFVKVRRA